jgi:hypothetical protein
VRAASAGSPWHTAFAWETACKNIEKDTAGYFSHLAGWTHTYVNFETAVAVEIEIARVNGRPIRTAAVHPHRKASACTIRDGRAYVRLDNPSLVAVDIDGQMDGQNTGKGYKGPPIHTISIFANPPVTGKPKPGDPDVLTVTPGGSSGNASIPSTGSNGAILITGWRKAGWTVAVLTCSWNTRPAGT